MTPKTGTEFERYLEHFCGYIDAIAYRFTSNGFDRDDLSQELVVHGWTCWTRYKGKRLEDRRALVGRAIRTKATDWLRTQLRGLDSRLKNGKMNPADVNRRSSGLDEERLFATVLAAVRVGLTARQAAVLDLLVQFDEALHKAAVAAYERRQGRQDFHADEVLVTLTLLGERSGMSKASVSRILSDLHDRTVAVLEDTTW